MRSGRSSALGIVWVLLLLLLVACWAGWAGAAKTEGKEQLQARGGVRVVNS